MKKNRKLFHSDKKSHKEMFQIIFNVSANFHMNWEVHSTVWARHYS